jgi:hypothetical protein
VRIAQVSRPTNVSRLRRAIFARAWSINKVAGAATFSVARSKYPRAQRRALPGILSPYRKKDPHPAGDPIFVPGGDLVPTGPTQTVFEFPLCRLCLPYLAVTNAIRR